MRATIMLLLLYTLSQGKVTDTSVCDGINDAIAVIVQHKKLIQEKIYYQEMTPTTTYHAGIEIRNRLSVIIDSMVYGKRGPADKKLVRSFLSYRQAFIEALNGSHIICDTISINFLSNLLKCDDEEMFGIVAQDLYEKTGFDALRSQSKHIKSNIMLSPQKWRAVTLLSLLNLTKAEKDSIMSAKLPLNIKANTGDTLAIDSLISRYKNEKDPSVKWVLANNNMSTGQKRSVKGILEDLSKPIYEITGQNTYSPCTSSVYQITTVNGLIRYFPKDTLLTKEFLKLVLVKNDGSPQSRTKVLQFWSKLEDWMWKHYEIKIGKTPPYPGIFLSCSQPSYVGPRLK